MTPLEMRILDHLRARPGRKVHELAAELQRDVRGVESALRLLERAGHVTRGEDAESIVTWSAVEPPEAA